MTAQFPITDEHIHIDPRAKGLRAVREFKNAGGTHMIVVSKPSWTLGVNVSTAEDYRIVFDETVEIVKQINEMGVGAYSVLGVHPAEISKLTERMSLEEASSLMKAGLDIAAGYVEKGLAVGLKSGRPHYPVSDEIWKASNEIMSHAFDLGKDLGCVVQIHTESVGEPELRDIASIAKKSGFPLGKVVKHYAPPLVDVCEKIGLFPGVLAGKGAIEKALLQGSRFMMETDYIDDPKRPGAVLGPKTIPRRTLKLVEDFGDDIFWKVHKENVEEVYEVEINL
ncbi:TatD family hydrolase [Methanohalophilus sp.]|uniref:TatD family hydrolase n=1 Tax=Methanohalophilus sp. TaxID=1966352 RepID=UPI00260E8AA0|nr:TatD family hydrolase [Methanohalophilus sp.]